MWVDAIGWAAITFSALGAAWCVVMMVRDRLEERRLRLPSRVTGFEPFDADETLMCELRDSNGATYVQGLRGWWFRFDGTRWCIECRSPMFTVPGLVTWVGGRVIGAGGRTVFELEWPQGGLSVTTMDGSLRVEGIRIALSFPGEDRNVVRVRPEPRAV